MSEDEELVEGRVRRGRALLAGALGLALLASLPFAFGLVSGRRAPPETATGSPPPGTGTEGAAPAFHGRLVYTTFETDGPPDRQQRLVVLDLVTGEVTEGPLVPSAEELHSAGARGEELLLIADDAGAQGVAYLLRDLSPGAPLREVASGDVLSLSTDGTALLVGRTRRTSGGGAGCEPHAYSLHRVDLASGRERFLFEERVDCGNLVSATLDRRLLVASVVRDGGAEVRAIWPQNPTVLFRGLAHVSVSPRGTLLFVDPEGGVLKGLGVWPRTPTGRALVWPGSGSPRPLVNDVRLFAQRVLAWSPDGGHVVVNGIVEDERGMWLVYVPAGTIEPVLPPNSFPLRSAFSGATFDDEGTVFAGSPGTIVASTPTGIVPLELPLGAPSPVGPVAWLP